MCILLSYDILEQITNLTVINVFKCSAKINCKYIADSFSLGFKRTISLGLAPEDFTIVQTVVHSHRLNVGIVFFPWN